MREKHKLRVFENRVLRELFGTKRDEVTGEWRKLHNEGLRNLCSTNIWMIKYRMRWERNVVCMEERTKCIRGFVEVTRLLGRPMRRWKDNIIMDLK